MKSLLVIFAFLMLSRDSAAQSAIDYFIPSNGNNKSVFHTPNPAGDKTLSQTHLYFIRHGDKGIELVWDEMFKGETTFIDTKYLRVDGNDIVLERETHFTGKTPNIYKDYSPPQIIFKMPLGNQKLKWTYFGINGELYQCTSYQASLSVNGKLKKAVKVDKIAMDKSGKVFDWANTSEYYVQGIGLLKIVLLTKTKDVYKIMDFQTTDSSVISNN